MADRIRIEPKAETSREPLRPHSTSNGAGSLGVLFRQLADDSRLLIRQEVALAKVELKDGLKSLAVNMVTVGLGGLLVGVGLLVLSAFLVIGLGRLLNDSYWLSSLIVGVAFILLGGVALAVGRRGLRNGELKPDQTAASLRENGEWARAEIEQIRRDLT